MVELPPPHRMAVSGTPENLEEDRVSGVVFVSTS